MNGTAGKAAMTGLASVAAVSAALAAGGAAARTTYGFGLGPGHGPDLGYRDGYGPRLLGDRIDASIYDLRLADLHGLEVLGAFGEEIGEVQKLVRNCNLYAVVDVAPRPGIVSREIVVPLDQLTVTDAGVLLENGTRDSVNQFPEYRAGMGLFSTKSSSGKESVDSEPEGGEAGWDSCHLFTGTEGAGEDLAQGFSASSSGKLEVRVSALEGADAFGPEEAELGQIVRVIRPNNAYAVIELDGGWFSGGGTAVVPLQRLVRNEDGVILKADTEDTIGRYSLEGGIYGDFWSRGYVEIDGSHYATIGEVYGY